MVGNWFEKKGDWICIVHMGMAPQLWPLPKTIYLFLAICRVFGRGIFSMTGSNINHPNPDV